MCQAAFAAVALIPWAAYADDTELRDIDVTGWPCLNQPRGTAKTPDRTERNPMKNRAPVSLEGRKIEELDTAGFLKKVAAYDANLSAQRRTQLGGPQKAQLREFEDQIVSLTGYLVLAYPGPPETTNCGDRRFHDWHLELFEQPSGHGPEVGDPTAIICEITPHTEQLLYRDGVRLQQLAGFFRTQKQYVSTNHPPQLVKVTGYLTWDDEHNGTADIGSTAAYFTSGNGFHHPWRSTAWEIHPVLKLEAISATANQPKPVTAPSPAIAQPPSATSTPAPAVAATPRFATITKAVTIQIPYGHTVLQPGIRVEVIATAPDYVTIRYMGASYRIPVAATHRR